MTKNLARWSPFVIALLIVASGPQSSSGADAKPDQPNWLLDSPELQNHDNKSYSAGKFILFPAKDHKFVVVKFELTALTADPKATEELATAQKMSVADRKALGGLPATGRCFDMAKLWLVDANGGRHPALWNTDDAIATDVVTLTGTSSSEGRELAHWSKARRSASKMTKEIRDRLIKLKTIEANHPDFRTSFSGLLEANQEVKVSFLFQLPDLVSRDGLQVVYDNEPPAVLGGFPIVAEAGKADAKAKPDSKGKPDAGTSDTKSKPVGVGIPDGPGDLNPVNAPDGKPQPAFAAGNPDENPKGGIPNPKGKTSKLDDGKSGDGLPKWEMADIVVSGYGNAYSKDQVALSPVPGNTFVQVSFKLTAVRPDTKAIDTYARIWNGIDRRALSKRIGDGARFFDMRNLYLVDPAGNRYPAIWNLDNNVRTNIYSAEITSNSTSTRQTSSWKHVPSDIWIDAEQSFLTRTVRAPNGQVAVEHLTSFSGILWVQRPVTLKFLFSVPPTTDFTGWHLELDSESFPITAAQAAPASPPTTAPATPTAP